MSITVQQVALKLRYLMNDMDMKEVSAPQMLNLMDDLFKTVNTELAKVGSRITVKMGTALTVTDGQAELPSNFYRIISLDYGDTGTYYTIIGNIVYTDGDSIDLLYYGVFDSVDSLEDTFDLPDNYLPILSRLAKTMIEDDVQKQEFYLGKIRGMAVRASRAGTEYPMQFRVVG